MNGAEGRWNAVRRVLAARTQEPPLGRCSRARDIAASFAQERLWFLDKLHPGSNAYNTGIACALSGPLDVRALADSLGELVARHEALRTTLRVDGKQLVQVIAPPVPLALGVEDVTDVAAWAHAASAEPFALDRGPLFRPRLARSAPNEHCLLLSIHHAVCDAWSVQVIMRELCALYNAHAAGGPAAIGASPLQCADVSVWQRERFREPRRDLIEYWNAQLRGAPPALRLPGDRARESRIPGRGEAISDSVSAELCDSLEALARQHGVTLNAVLLAAFVTLLHRHTGADDIIVGAPIANRDRPELDGVVGLLANTLPLRTNLAGDPTFLEALSRVQDTVSGAFAHQDLPFELLVKATGHAGTPLFGTMFAFQNIPRTHWSSPEVHAQLWNVPPTTAKFELALTMQRHATGASALLEYDADRFDAASIERMLCQLRRLLEGVVDDPERRLSELPLLSAPERAAMIAAWTARRGGDDLLPIHRVFEQQARRSPESIAITSEAGTFTYRDVEERANQLAHHLIALDLGPEPLVGVCIDRSPAFVMAVLAILKSGGAYVPIDRLAPASRATQMLDRVAAIICDSSWQPTERHVPVVDIDDPAICPRPVICPDIPSSPEQLAYVMFTSGSSGAPRGVCVPHRGVTRLVVGTDYAHFGPDEKLLQLAPVAFDASTFEIWGALLNGATLVIAPPRPHSIAELGRLIARHRITTVWLTSGLFELVVDTGVDVLAGVRQVLTGGDVMSASHARRFLARMPHCRLINGYGPTENTTFTSTHLVEHVDGASVPIGRPIAGTRVYVLDARREPVPPGVIGEAYVAGDGLARGYLDDPDATRDRFVSDPFVSRDVVYRTGDLVRMRNDGALDFVGRNDRQLKIRGYRVEPAEIEAQLRASPDVARAAVIDVDDERLVAYVVPRDHDEGVASRVAHHLRTRLPSYLQPSRIVVVSQLPLTTNGKIDRSALATAAEPAPVRSASTMDAYEQQLARLYEQVLGVRVAGVTDNFFELGGDSFTAIELAALIESRVGYEIPLASLFEKPTIATLAEELRDRTRAPADLGRYLVRIKEGTRAAALFLVAGGRGGRAELAICAKLAARLDPSERVFGVMPPRGGTTLEAIAADCVREVQRIQPKGPYRLGGECTGGLVAYEIAQQLCAAGERVELLLLIDTWCPSDKGVLYHNWIGQPRALIRAGLAFLASLPRRPRDAEAWPVELWRRAVAPAPERRHVRACMRYRPRPFSIPLTLLACEDNIRRGLVAGWAQVASSGIAVHTAPGDHDTYSREHADRTAEVLRNCLESAATVDVRR